MRGSGLVVGRASYGASTAAAGPAIGHRQDANVERGTRHRKDGRPPRNGAATDTVSLPRPHKAPRCVQKCVQNAQNAGPLASWQNSKLWCGYDLGERG